MAEALAGASAAASILQLIEFSAKLIARINDFHSSYEQTPAVFRDAKMELPLLLDTLEKINEEVYAGRLSDKVQQSLESISAACLEQINLLNEILDKLLPQSSDSRIQKAKKAILSIPKDAKIDRIKACLRSHVQTLTFYYSVTTSTSNPPDDHLLAKMRSWLSPPDPSINYYKAIKQRQSNTGLWFIEGEKFQSWKINPSSFLWLHGMPGCGKSILFSSVVENLLEFCDDDPGKAIAYFYFDFQDVEKQYSDLMIRSLISQVSQQCTRIPEPLKNLISSDKYRKPPREVLLQALKQLIKEIPDCFVLLDALDECSDRLELMELIQTMAEWRYDSLHLLVTSRNERDIGDSIQLFAKDEDFIALESETVNKDIGAYVRQRLREGKLAKWHKDSAEIEAALMKKSYGMFRWAACQLDTLSRCLTRSKLREALNQLPPTLDDTYDRILCSIPEEYSTYARCILVWLAFSARPLRLDEVAEVIAIDPEQEPSFDKDGVLEDPLDALTICSSLVTQITIEERGSVGGAVVLGLAHFSVKEYLLSLRIQKARGAYYGLKQEESHAFIAKSCLKYLLQFRARTFNAKIQESFKLAKYGAEFWIAHSQAAGRNQATIRELEYELFSDRSGAYWNWIRLFNPEYPYSSVQDIRPPLYTAASAGLTDVILQLIERDEVDVNEISYFDGTALQAAALKGDKKTIELLLTQGADPNVHERADYSAYLGSPLQLATLSGNEEIVEMILSHGADVNAQLGQDDCALISAASRGYEKIVELLLSKGADANVSGIRYTSAIAAASLIGCERVVKVLLEHGADVNLKSVSATETGRTAICAAAAHGSISIVEMLLKAGADVNEQGGWLGHGPLWEAAIGGHTRIVQLLISYGADVNQGAKEGTALSEAVRRGDEGMARLLLDHGADPNLNEHRVNPLAEAARAGNERMVHLLLDRGASLTVSGTKDLENRSPLLVASRNGHERILELFLKRGTNLVADDYGQALMLAASKKRTKVVELLLKRGANVNWANDEHGSALAFAAQYANEETIEVLLRHGADPNANHGERNPPLFSASIRGLDRIVNMLLRSGADPNTKGLWSETSLIEALARGHKKIAKMLLEAGADPNMVAPPDAGYGEISPLMCASNIGDMLSIELLLSKGADPAVQYPNGDALSMAAGMGHKPACELLLSSIAKTGSNFDYRNSIAAASEKGRTDIVHLLLAKGVVDNALDEPFGRALQAASSNGHKNIVELLLSRGADVNAVSSGPRPKNALLEASRYGHHDIVELLLEHGADIDLITVPNGHSPVIDLPMHMRKFTLGKMTGSRDNHGPAIVTASRHSHNRIVDALLAAAKCSKKGENDQAYGKALIAAAEVGHVAIAEKLLTAGADPNFESTLCGNPLAAASYNGHEQVVEVLINAGAAVNGLCGNIFKSPLSAASAGGWLHVVELLLEFGADINPEDGDGDDPITAASKNGHHLIVKFLLAKGAKGEIIEPDQTQWALSSYLEPLNSYAKEVIES